MSATAIPELVQRLLIYEAGKAQSHQATTEAAERACEKLRLHLTKRVGRDGFRTLLVRALSLATTQFPLLQTVRVATDGTLEGLRFAPASGTQGPNEEAASEIAAGAVAIVEHLALLLVTFVGEDLTLRLLVTVWPLLDENDAGSEGNNLPGREEQTP